MKALVYTAPNQVLYRDEPDPEPVAGEVLIRIEAAGICGSDLHAWRGHDPRRVPPLILGHELAGRVLGMAGIRFYKPAEAEMKQWVDACGEQRAERDEHKVELAGSTASFDKLRSAANAKGRYTVGDYQG